MISPRRIIWLWNLLMVGLVCAEDWPHYLGPNGDGSIREIGLRTTFDKPPPPLIWKQDLGGGYSSPSISNGRVFVMDRVSTSHATPTTSGNPNFFRTSTPGKERLRAMSADTGRLLWDYEYYCPYSTVSLYAIGPRCTPTVDEDRVYALGAEGDLHCLQTVSGKVLWSIDFKEDYRLKIPDWGCAAHPLVWNDQLICMVGGRGSTVVSFDKNTGRERWRSLSASKPGYCPPTIATIHGLEQLLVWHGEGLASLNPANGLSHWFAKAKPHYGMAIGAPRVHGDLVHVMGYKGLSVAIKVGADNQSATIHWGNDLRKGVAGVLNTAHLDANGYLYSAGGGHDFKCVDIRDGSNTWQTSLPVRSQKMDRPGAWPSAFTYDYPGSLRTFIYNDHGELISAVLSPEGYQEIDRIKLIDPTHRVGGRMLVWSGLAFANRHVYLRNDLEIRCYDLSAIRMEP